MQPCRCARGLWGQVLMQPWSHLTLLCPCSLSEETFYGPDCLYPQKVTPGGPCGTASRWHRGTVAPRHGIARRSPAAFCPQKLRLDSEAKHSQSHTTVDVQVMVTQGHGARRFRQAATLVVAATKMLRRPSHKDFADSDLGGFLEEIFGKDAVLGGGVVGGGGGLRGAADTS